MPAPREISSQSGAYPLRHAAPSGCLSPAAISGAELALLPHCSSCSGVARGEGESVLSLLSLRGSSCGKREWRAQRDYVKTGRAMQCQAGVSVMRAALRRERRGQRGDD
jgi:hypothetical protein